MKISFDQSVVSDSRWFPILDVILMLVEDGRHSLAAENLDFVLESAWIQSRGRESRELVRLTSTGYSYDALADQTNVIVDVGVRRGGIVDMANSTTKLHPSDAIFFLSMPFQVIVENENFDGAFLLWMARALGFTKFITAYRDRRFMFRHAGGKDWIPSSAKVFSDGVWARRDEAYSRAFRLWLCVMLDNDARYPGDAPNASLIEKASECVAFVHQLRRRSIESYIPAGKLRRLDQSPNFARKVAALERLTDLQRTHFHMKRGFRFDGTSLPSKAAYMTSATVKSEEKALFQSVSDIDWPEIMDGFGRSLANIYTDEKYRPSVNDPAITCKDDKREIRMLLEEIYKRL